MFDLVNFGFKFLAKFSVSNSALWFVAINVFLKFLDLFLDWRKADSEQKKAYVSFIEAMAKKNLVSVSLRESAKSQYDQLNEK